jgi:ribonuclease BN (tRNA processing enzyme)
MLVDCGATSLTAMKRAAVDPSGIGHVVVSHLHGDHFGGVPFLVLDGQFARRERPLVIAGPPGTEARVTQALEVLFPGSSTTTRRFGLEFVELADRVPTPVGPAVITGYTVEHSCGAPPYALRIDYADRSIAYSGDTEWTDALVDVAAGADVFVCEAYFFDKRIKYHLDYMTLRAQLERLSCRRIVLTHMSGDMLDRRADVDLDCAEDGLVITI